MARFFLPAGAFLFFIHLLGTNKLNAQSPTNLLLNGGFEDVNTCEEYGAECGVEGWFYLQNVKAQMLSNDGAIPALGSNSFGISTQWTGYEGFSPVIGTALPCALRAQEEYTFTGIISAQLNPKLLLEPGVALGEKYYVPRRPFAKDIVPVSLGELTQIPNSNYYTFRYRFIATGKERYLTFGIYVKEDTTTKRLVNKKETVTLVFDDFKLTPTHASETACADFLSNKEKIYRYNWRHKDMDYTLYGKGQIPFTINQADSNNITGYIVPQPKVADTLLLGDVFFDFNKAVLQPAALSMLEDFFAQQTTATIDSIYIEGHTDSIGSNSQNLQLSQQRSTAVKEWLLTRQIAEEKNILLKAWGKEKPVADNSTPEGRSKNRRVEMYIFYRNDE